MAAARSRGDLRLAACGCRRLPDVYGQRRRRESCDCRRRAVIPSARKQDRRHRKSPVGQRTRVGRGATVACEREAHGRPIRHRVSVPVEHGTRDERHRGLILYPARILSVHRQPDRLLRVRLNGIGDVVEDAADVDGRMTARRQVAEERAERRVDRWIRFAVHGEVRR